MVADNEEHLVCGLVNEATVNEQLIYTVLFERRADLNIGSFTLERIVNHAGIVALHMACNDGKYRLNMYHGISASTDIREDSFMIM